MEREISTGAMLGIVLLALAAVIGLGFGVFAITKGVANEGTVSVQDSLGSVATQVFLDFDQKVVSGQQLQSAVKTFEGKPVAVLISTRAMQEDGPIAPGHKATVLNATLSKNDYDFVNYNALLAKASGSEAITPIGSDQGVSIKGKGAKTILTLNNGVLETKEGLLAVEGEIQMDKVTAGIFKTGNAEYIASTSKFQSYLVKDKSGNIMGIAAYQR